LFLYYGTVIKDEDFKKLDEVALKNSINRYRMKINAINQSVVAEEMK